MGIPQPAFYLFMCSVERPAGFPKGSCIKPHNRDLFGYLTEQLMRKGIIATVQPVQTSCQGRCQLGPVMLVEPGHTMYVGLDKEKIDRIIEEHILGGTPVAEYMIPGEMWADPISPAEMKARAGV
ncbi:MAG: (2Fe-2S) ferredoxin domain-containing protein [Campylobacterales bacterium]